MSTIIPAPAPQEFPWQPLLSVGSGQWAVDVPGNDMEHWNTAVEHWHLSKGLVSSTSTGIPTTIANSCHSIIVPSVIMIDTTST
jgi:hypothetical protein